MGANPIFAPEALQDLDEAYAWYEQRRSGLGEQFLTSVDACLERLSRNPLLYSPVYKNYRRALVRRFPYAVYFEFFEPQVFIYCVFHTSRDPKKWRARLP